MRNNKKIDDQIRLEILNSYLHGSKGKYTIEKENGISRGAIRKMASYLWAGRQTIPIIYEG